MRAGFVSIISLLTISNIIAKILGFGKDILISYYYGTSDLTDGFFLAFSIPTIIIGVFTADRLFLCKKCFGSLRSIGIWCEDSKRGL